MVVCMAMEKKPTLGDHWHSNDRWVRGSGKSMQAIIDRLTDEVDTMQAIIDSLADELIVIDRDSRVVRVNSAVLQRHGIELSSVIGRPCYEVTHGSLEPCQVPNCECPAPNVWKSGRATRVCHVHRHYTEGSTQERYVEIVASPLRDHKGKIVAMVELARDTTEAKRLTAQSAETSQNLLALTVIAGMVSQSLDLDTILEIALDKVLELMKGNVGGILLLDGESQTLSYRVSRGLSTKFLEGIAGLRVGEGLAGRVAQLEQPIYVDDVSQDPRLTRSVVISEGLRAFASVPLRSKSQLLGVMNIASRAPRRFRAEDVQLLTSVANLVAIVVENAKLYNEVRQRDEMRGELLRQIMSTHEDERNRIARELHDETSQALTGLGVSLQAVINSLPLETEQLRAQLEKMQSMAMTAHDEIHRVIYELRPRLLDDLGLMSAAKLYAENQLKPSGVAVNLERLGIERRLPAEIETALFRIMQEATTNVLRHAGAHCINVTIEFRDKWVVARIEDDGRGFDIDQVMRSRGRSGLGLLGMRERAEALGGKLIVASRPGAGTRLTAEIPVGGEVDDGKNKGIDSR